MKAVVKLSDETQEVEVKQLPIPTPQPGELLIRVEASPINPSDQMTLQGEYKPPSLPPAPFTVGLEGAGVVVEVGEGVDKDQWINKKVSFLSRGTWSEYVCLPAAYPMKIEMSDKVESIDIASFWVNPMTVVAMYDVARKAGIEAVAHNAGASTLGRQLIRLSQKKGFQVINVVRREAQVEALHAMGSKYIVNMSKEGWQKEFHDMTHKLGATVLFDAIGGKIASEFLNEMPPNSTLYNYGALSGQPLSGFTANTFIFQGKSVTGFNMGVALAGMKVLESKDYAQTIAQDLNTGGAIFGSKVAKTFPLEQYKEAVEYANSHTLDGKVYLVPSK